MNRIAVRTFPPVLAALAGFCLLALGLTGCNMNPEKNPAFIKLQNQVKALEESQKKTADSIKGINIDVTTLDETVRTLKTEVQGMGGNPQQAETVTKRIEALEQQVQALQGKTSATGKPSGELPKKGETAKPEPAKASGAAKPAGAAKTPGAGKTPASAKPGAAAVKPAPAAEAGAPAKVTGKYYTTQTGDTLQSLAQQHGISAAKIAEANRLPADASLMPGQSVFIPNP
jgi:LysM repeat protein